MTTYIALLRAVNVGGTGKLPMADLKALCAELGFLRIATYIASGNVVFDSKLASRTVRAQLEQSLLAYAGKEIGVFVRSAAEMRSVLEVNPFSKHKPQNVYALFLNDPPQGAVLDGVRGRKDEQIILGEREIYVFYPQGMGQSTLQIPAARTGTARNINTVTRLVEMSERG